MLRHRKITWLNYQYLRSFKFCASITQVKIIMIKEELLCIVKLLWDSSVCLVSSLQFQTTINKIWDSKQTYVIPTGTGRQQSFFLLGKQLFYCAWYVFRKLNNLSSEVLKFTCTYINIYLTEDFGRKKGKLQSIF